MVTPASLGANGCAHAVPVTSPTMIPTAEINVLMDALPTVSSVLIFACSPAIMSRLAPYRDPRKADGDGPIEFSSPGDFGLPDHSLSQMMTPLELSPRADAGPREGTQRWLF